MLVIMGNSALFAQLAGRGGRKTPVIKFTSSTDDPYIQALSCNGTITIESTKDGQPVVETYKDLDLITVNIQADADTEVKISGYVIDLYFTAYDEDQEDYSGFTDLSSLDLSETNVLKALSVDYNSGLEELDVTHNTNLQTLIFGDMENLTGIDVSKNTKLTYLYCAYCEGITELNLAANTALQTLDCNSCTSITELNLAANTALQNLYCNSCTSLSDISYPATNSDVSTAIAGAITNANAADGTVYTDGEGAYYSTIADAATTKGWTIEQL